MRQNPSLGVAARTADPAGILQCCVNADIADDQREEHAPAQDYSKRISSSIYTVIGHLQREGSDQGLCGCSCCTIHLSYRYHLLGCGSNKQVIMLRSEGLGVPLGSSRGPGRASGGPGSASGGLWGPCGCKIR